jgi:hypothetical protein
MNLKALAYKVLERNPSRNQAATRPKNRRNFSRKQGVKYTSKLPPRNEWEEDLIRIIDWVLIFKPPLQPFLLHRAIKVVDPVGFWNMLKSDIAAGQTVPAPNTAVFNETFVNFLSCLEFRHEI